MRRDLILVSVGAVAVAACATLPTASVTPTTAPTANATATPVSSTSAFASVNFRVPLNLTMVDGWVVDGDHPGNIDLQRGEQDAGISSIADTTVAVMSGGKAPWPEDMMTWLNSRTEFTPGAPRQVMVGGRAATQVDVNVKASGTRIEMVCNQACWLVDGNFVMSFTEVRNADGTGIVVITEVPADRLVDWSQSLDQLLATLTFR